MKLINHILLPCLMLTGAMTAGESKVYAAGTAAFPEQSVLSKGKWVKIYFDKTGIYELTDDELRAMGFENPAMIGIYGRGGGLQPTQFVSPNGESYVSDLQPVAMERRNGKVYFYGQANPKVRYCKENDTRPGAMRFERESNQVYADDVVYFITDTPDKRNFVELVSDQTYNSSLPPMTEAWAYSYHEVDLSTPVSSGREFWGESFVNAADRERKFPYSIPGAVAGSEAVITALFATNSGATSQLEFGFAGDGEGSTSSVNIPAKSEYDNYKYNSRTYVAAPVPGGEGEVVFRFKPSAEDVGFAALDYFVVGAKRELRFQPGETQFAIYPYEFTKRKYSWLQLPDVCPTYDFWQVSDPGNVKQLSYRMQSDHTRVLFLADNHDGPLVCFDYSQEQYKVKGYEPVANQNLHALGTETIPAMVIITLPELKPAAERLAAIHKEKEGVDVAVVLHSDVVNEFSAGVDDPMAYRALAKMIYDRDDPARRVFKNILLLGPNVRDHRNVLGIVPEIGTLICNQAYSSSTSDYSYCLNDWYGMMDDKTAYEQTSTQYFRTVPMQVGVGLIPVNTLGEAQAVVDKVERFYDDDSFAWWLSSFNYVADGGDNNEHQNWQEELWKAMDACTSSAGLGTKIYNNLCVDMGSRDMLINKVNEGSLVTYYTGHANSAFIGEYLLYTGSEYMFKNNRYGIALWGACDVSPFDNNKTGMGTRLFTIPETCFVAAIGSSRSGYSRHNYNFLQTMQRFMLLDDINDAEKPLSAPRTLGEIYALSKTAVTNHANKFVFHLLGDPAIVLPLPTADVKVTLGDTDPAKVYPGSAIKIEGTVTARDGKLLDGYNGTVVARLCAPSVVRKTHTRQGSPSVDVSLDQTSVYTTSFEVKNGRFSGTMLVPANTPECEDEESLTMRLTAYDPATRTGAAGALAMQVTAYDDSKAVPADMPPAVEAMYADSPDYGEDDPVAGSFTLHADITDDYGLMAYDVNGIPSLYLSVDGRNTRFDLNGYISMSEGGKRMHVAYPLTEIAEGRHIISLTATDANGQSVTETRTVTVGETLEGTPVLAETDGPHRESVRILVSESSASRADTLRIVDATGKCVLSAPVTEGSYDWNLLDSKGQRVPEGVYYAICVQHRPGKGTALSAPLELVILN